MHSGSGLTLSALTVRGGVDFSASAIRVAVGSPLSLINVEVTGNHSVLSGGPAINANGPLSFLGVTVAGNTSVGGAECGGGIRITGTGSTLVNTTVSGNRALCGGGISNSGTVSLVNVTITDNTAGSDTSAGTGGGIHAAGPVTVRDTIIAGNRLGSAPGSVGPDCAGSMASNGYNLIENLGDCTLSGSANNIAGVSAQLGPLAANGGPTRTHALLPGSPALDK